MRSLLLPLCTALLSFAAAAQDGKAADTKTLQKEGRQAVQNQDWKTAIADFQKLTELEPTVGTHWHMLGYSLHAANRLDEALKVHLKAAEFADVKPVASYNVACVYALKSDKDKAFEWLGKAVDAGFARPEQLTDDTDMDSLRSDARWQGIVARVDKAAAALAKMPGQAQAFADTSTRRSSRVVWFDRSGSSPGQVVVDYAPVPWQDKYDELVESPKFMGKHWRLGANYWTSLDTMLPMAIGDVKLEPGQYYLTLVHETDGKFNLYVHDAAEIRKQRLDAFQAPKLSGGKPIALEHKKSETVAKELAMGIELAKGSPQGEFVVRFGGHVLSSKVEIAIP